LKIKIINYKTTCKSQARKLMRRINLYINIARLI